MNKSKEKITLVQSILIAIGFVVGSGIFFRADNILSATGGNLLIAILGWLFLGTTLIFAGITVSVLAERTKLTGGISSYFEELYGKKAGFVVGFFMSTIYAPLLIGVLSKTFMTYFFQLIGADSSNKLLFYSAVIVLLFFVYFWNFISTKIGAKVSSFATIIKIIPLIIVGVIGVIFGNHEQITQAGLGVNETVKTLNIQDASFLALFTAPFVSMGFAFDGWISVSSLTNDIKDPKKNLPKTLILGTIAITSIYLLYFIGVSILMPINEIIATGDEHVGIIAMNIFGRFGGSLTLLCVIISIMGTLNSNIMAGMRYPSSLARENEFMYSEKIGKINSKTGTPVNGGLYCVVISAISVTLYALQDTFGMFNGITFDDIPVIVLSLFYIVLFIGIFKLGRKEKLSKFKTIVAPIIATIGQLLIAISFFMTNSQAVLYLSIVIAIVIIGYMTRTIGNQTA